MHNETGSIQSRKDFKKSPAGQYKYWIKELKASDVTLKNFRKDGGKIDDRFKGGKRKTVTEDSKRGSSGQFRLNLFHSNVTTLQAMLYSNVPKVDVSRRYNDPEDDVGRVASEIIERLLNNDVKENAESYNSIFKAAVQDRLLPGLGLARVRYEYDEKQKMEDAPLEYIHWRDVTWGWARTFSEVPWIGFRSYLTKDEIEDRFGEDAAEGVELESQSTTDKDEELKSTEDGGPWQKAQVWEIWDKTQKKVVWVSPGYDKVLETKKDFLNLAGFYPCPPFMLANQTTTLYTPTSDYYLSQDLYNEIDILQSRISIITDAVKVVGVYNSAAGDSIGRMLKEGADNDLIPVDNWALFGENGGIAGQIDWIPMQEIVDTLGKLRELRDETIGLLQQVSGMSDIMRGELGGQYEGVGQSQLKAKFGSIRIQSLQEEFAQFISKLMSIKAEIISLHYDDETIARCASAGTFMEADKELVPEAIKLIKQPKQLRLQIIVKPESMALIDYAQLKQERTEFLDSIGGFLQSAFPLMEASPETTPFILQLLQWGLAGLKGSQQIEGVVDKAIQLTTKKQQEGGDDGNKEAAAEQAKAAAEQAKHKMSMELEQAKHKNAMEQLQAKAQADNQVRQADLQADVAKIRAELQAEMEEIKAKMMADIKTEQVTSQINAEQARLAMEGEMEKEVISTALSIEAEKEKQDGAAKTKE